MWVQRVPTFGEERSGRKTYIPRRTPSGRKTYIPGPHPRMEPIRARNSETKNTKLPNLRCVVVAWLSTSYSDASCGGKRFSSQFLGGAYPIVFQSSLKIELKAPKKLLRSAAQPWSFFRKGPEGGSSNDTPQSRPHSKRNNWLLCSLWRDLLRRGMLNWLNLSCISSHNVHAFYRAFCRAEPNVCCVSK